MRNWEMRSSLAIACGLALYGAGAAAADIYEFTFEGVIDNVTGPVPGPWDQVESGDSFIYSYRFDSETPDLIGHPFTGLYTPISLDLTIDGVTQSTTTGEILVVPNQEYSTFFTGLPIGATTGVAVVNPLLGVLPTDELPLDLDLSEWGFAGLEVVQNGGGWRTTGDVLSFHSEIVPAPPVLAALGIGLVGRRHRRRRRRDP